MSICVIDANTIISATLSPNGTSWRARAAARAQGTIALSNSVFGEIGEVLSRPKFSRVLTADRRRELLELLAAAALWFDPVDKVEDCRDGRDAKDNWYLELALAAQAAVIISGMRICWCSTHGAASGCFGLLNSFRSLNMMGGRAIHSRLVQILHGRFLPPA